MEIECPSCHRIGEGVEAHIGQAVTCPCGRAFVVPPPPGAPCPKCGTILDNALGACPHCRPAPLPPSPEPLLTGNDAPPPRRAKSWGMALSLVLALAISGVVVIYLGAKFRLTHHPAQQQQFQQFPPSSQAMNATCLSNLRVLTTSILMYAQDHEGKLADQAKFWQAIRVDKPFLRCPQAMARPMGYGINTRLCGVNLKKVLTPSMTILLADGNNSRGWLLSPADIDIRRHGAHNFNISCVDGSVQSRTAPAGNSDFMP